MTLFDDGPLKEVFNMGVNSHDSSNDEEDAGDVNSKEADWVENSGYFSCKDGDDDAEKPKQAKDKTMIFKEGFSFDESFGLGKGSTNVLHFYLY